MNKTFFATQSEFRAWLEDHAEAALELHLAFHKKSSGKPSITYQEALDEALCFGWIDGVRRSIDGESYMIRFTPRRRHSIWSAINIKRADELKAAGLMQPAGLKAFEERRRDKEGTYSYERPQALPAQYEEEFRKNPNAWQYFQAQPAGYRQVACHWVASAKKEETRLRRLATLIADSEHGERLAQYTLKPRDKGQA